MKRTSRFLPAQIYHGLLLAAIFLISNQRILFCDVNPACRYVDFPADYMMWGLIVFVALLFLVQSGKLGTYWQAWRMNWSLGLFILYSLASISWSIVPERSVHTVFIMAASSVTGAILAVIYSPKGLLKIFFILTLIGAMLSLSLVLAYPGMGIHQDPIWFGSWRGIFGHKNDLGPLMALGNSLALLSFARSESKRDTALSVFAYILTLFLAVMTRSASALVLCAILNGFSVIYFAWIRWHALIQGRRLAYVLSLSAAVAVLGPLSLIVISSLMGKSLNLTGRIPLWMNLLENVVSKKPWFGYGLETLWYFPAFQKWASTTSGWGDTIVVVNGHNGYMDILLYLGLVGLAILCVVLVQGLVRATRRARIGLNWLDFFPLLVLVYFLVANITVDYMLEFECFHWIILVSVLFLPLGKFTEQDSG